MIDLGKQLTAALRSLDRKRATLAEVKQQAAVAVTKPGCQHPMKWELEQAQCAVWTAETLLNRVQKKITR